MPYYPQIVYGAMVEDGRAEAGVLINQSGGNASFYGTMFTVDSPAKITRVIGYR